jgi:hypothetical protein
MSSPLQDAAAALTTEDNAVLIVLTPNEEKPYTTRWVGPKYDILEDDATRVSETRTDMSLARVQSAWPQDTTE